MTDEPSMADLKSLYAGRISEDLAHNERERKRIAAEMKALQGELTCLEENHVLLEGLMQSLGEGAVAADVTVDTERTPADVPEVAMKGASEAPLKKEVAAVPRQQNARTEQHGKGGPTLIDLIVSQLGTFETPRAASEITSALHEGNPAREFNPKVVRNTLEALVAKGRAERMRQKRAVFYTAVRADTPGS
ncbi:hypothetical protein [Streptomyces sp. NPDC020681]|uniref:hypothetical protein n=1 Tax=Streptomyces sp. NPDC020681 TaxID=3365083 RepID=UPI0037AA4D97